MDPKSFGPFLRETRTKRELTQTQLAETLGVTTAAVSKWECGKCLPDIVKLEDLANALDLSILEIMRCEEAPSELPRQELHEVYTQTLQTSRQQHKRRWKIAAVIAAALVAFSAFYYQYPLHHFVKAWNSKVYTTYQLRTLFPRGSQEDRRTAEPILQLAQRAFSDLTHTDAENRNAYGELARYATPKKRGGYSEWHSLGLWAAEFSSNHGTMWVHHSSEIYDQNSKTICGSWDVLSLWTLKRNSNGQWEVINIIEQP